ncbi:MAG: hypothetical protein LBT39_10995, partial [Treponema sp.]|nr:hypothetical protein [Treponema sp.]
MNVRQLITRKTGATILCLVLGLLPVLSLSAQTPTTMLPLGFANSSENPFAELPEARSTPFPESSTSKATIGTISADGDYFMSVLDWSSINNMQSTFVLAGVDENGLVMGYAQKAGKVYLGVSYGGSLVDELFRRITNQDVDTLRKQDSVTKDPSTYSTSLLNQNDKTPPGVTISNNDVNLILGAGVFGLRLGFSEYIRAAEISDDETSTTVWNKEHGFESSLKPSLEMGFNFKAGPVRVKPAFRGAFDIHEYS